MAFVEYSVVARPTGVKRDEKFWFINFFETAQEIGGHVLPNHKSYAESLTHWMAKRRLDLNEMLALLKLACRRPLEVIKCRHLICRKHAKHLEFVEITVPGGHGRFCGVA